MSRYIIERADGKRDIGITTAPVGKMVSGYDGFPSLSRIQYSRQNLACDFETTPHTKMAGSDQYDISDTDLGEIYSFAIQLGKDAGAILLDSLHERRHDGVDLEGGETQDNNVPEELVMEEKLNSVDIVTKTDNGMYTPLARHDQLAD